MTYIKTQEKIVCGSSYMDFVEIDSCPSFLVEMLTDLNAPNDCAAISQKYRERAGQDYSVQEYFAGSELLANLERTAGTSEKSVYDHGIIRVILRKSLRKINDNAPEVKLFF